MSPLCLAMHPLVRAKRPKATLTAANSRTPIQYSPKSTCRPATDLPRSGIWSRDSLIGVIWWLQLSRLLLLLFSRLGSDRFISIHLTHPITEASGGVWLSLSGAAP